MAKPKKSLLSLLIRQLRAWHRKLGIVTAFFLIFLAATGMIINHANFFSLDTTPVTNTVILNFYGIKAPTDIRFYGNEDENGQIAVTDDFVWLNHQFLFESNATIIAAARYQSMWLVVTTEQLSLYSAQGELVDQLDSASGVPENISALAINQQNVIVKSDNKLRQTDSDFLTWQNVKTRQGIAWIEPVNVNTTHQLKKIQEATLQFKSRFLNWEKLLLDVHSGRIFGEFGVLISDFIAILLILLSLSGLYIWLRYSNNKR